MSEHLIYLFQKEQYEAESFMATVRQLMEVHPEYDGFHITIDHPPIVPNDPDSGCFDYMALYGEKNA